MSRQSLSSSPEIPLLQPSPPLNPNLLSPPLFLSPEKPPFFHHLHSPKMGCGMSRTESGEEIPSGLFPFMRRIQDLKRTKTDLSRKGRRERKDSIVSTTELLRPEERDIDYYDTTVMESSGEKDESNGKGNGVSDSSEIVEEKAVRAEEEEEKERRIGFGREIAAEEELPGSPSFRFYFTDAVQEMDSGGSVQAVKPDALKRIEEKGIEEKDSSEEKEDHTESLVTGEGSDFKAIKKEKGRKFMSLPKANFLNVKGCYNMNSCSLDAQEGTRILSDKAT